MNGLQRILGPICRGLDRVLGRVVATLFGILVLDVLWGVVSRYVMGSQSRWTEELAIALLVWVSLLGGALAYAEGAHLGVDMLLRKLEPSARRLAVFCTHLTVAVFAAFVLLGGGYVLVSETMAAGQTTPALGWRMGYVYLSVPISGATMLLFCAGFLLGLDPVSGRPGQPAEVPPPQG